MFAVIGTLVFSAAAQAGPDLKIPESTFDFGRVPQLAVVTHGFWLKSTGDDTVRVVRIDPGCGCTEIPLSDSSLAPGDSVLLQIFLNTSRYLGYISKKPEIMTNVSDQPFGLRIYALAVADPEEFSFVHRPVPEPHAA